MKQSGITLLLLLSVFLSKISLAAPPHRGWQSALQSTTGAFDGFFSVIDKNGNVFLSGQSISDTFQIGTFTLASGAVDVHFILVKANAAGIAQWAFGIQNSGSEPAGMAVDTAGNLYITGWYDSLHCTIGTFTLTNTYPPGAWGANQFFIAKLSPTGTVLWAKNCISSNGEVGAIGVDEAGNLYVDGVYTGATAQVDTAVLHNTGLGSNDMFVAKFNSLGNLEWAHSFGTSHLTYAGYIAVCLNGSFYLSGSFWDTIFVLGPDTLTTGYYLPPHITYIGNFYAKFDNNGNPLWADTLNYHVNVNSMTTDSVNNIYMAGYADSVTNLGTTAIIDTTGNDAFVAKFDSTGHNLWVRTAAGRLADKAVSVTTDVCGNVWTSVDVGDPPVTTDTLTASGHAIIAPAGSYDPLVIIGYDQDGSYLMSDVLPTGGDDFAGIMADNHGNLFIGGDSYIDTLHVGLSTVYNPTGSEIFFIARYWVGSLECSLYDTTGYDTTGTTAGIAIAKVNTNDITIYPNPAASECTIYSDAAFAVNARADIYDLVGRLVACSQIIGTNTVISVAHLAPGMYQCRITNGDNVVVRKLVVMR